MLGAVVFVAGLITGKTHSSQAFEQIFENSRFRAGRGLASEQGFQLFLPRFTYLKLLN
jgi:hypothetical protein